MPSPQSRTSRAPSFGRSGVPLYQVVTRAPVDLVHAGAPLHPVVALLAVDLDAAVPALQGVLAPRRRTLSFPSSA